MNTPVNMVIAGRDRAVARGLEALVTGQPGIAARVRLLEGANDIAALCTGADKPQLLLLICDDSALGDLEVLAALPAAQRPVLLLCGKLASAEAARLAMRCGASDLLPPGPSRAELLEALGRVRVQSMRTETLREPGSIIAVIGAAGGAGASFIASNLAFLIARKESRSAILIDMDLQYAPLSGYLGVRPENSLMKAVERVETLDRMALPGYVGRHPSGVGLVASLPNQELDTGPLPADRFQQLLHLLALQADRVLIDVPRWLDAAATVAVMEANYIVLVLQQTVGNVHNASRLYRMLTRHLGVPKDRIVVVLNRHSRRATVDSEDVERALSIEGVIEMPNDYELVRESLDAAQPLNERRSTIARGLELLSSRIGGPPVEGGGFLRRASTIFRKGDT